MNTRLLDSSCKHFGAITEGTKAELIHLGYSPSITRLTSPPGHGEDVLTKNEDFKTFLADLAVDGYTHLMLTIMAEVMHSWAVESNSSDAIDHSENVTLFLNAISEELG